MDEWLKVLEEVRPKVGQVGQASSDNHNGKFGNLQEERWKGEWPPSMDIRWLSVADLRMQTFWKAERQPFNKTISLCT